MSSYLTPGVYVKEIPAQSKPIEGVGTSVAAFVGIAPGGPPNTPVQIANWTQFARTFSKNPPPGPGDPPDPDAVPFVPGAFLAHAVYGYFQNGGGICWVVRVTSGGTPAEPPLTALPSAADPAVAAIEARPRPGVVGEVTVEIAAETAPTVGDGASDDVGPTTYRVIVSAGSEREEFEGLSAGRGRGGIVAKVNARSKLVELIEAGAASVEPAAGTYAVAAIPTASAAPPAAKDFEGNVARREGLGALAGIDEITMLCIPDVWALYGPDGDGDAEVCDIQRKASDHCQAMGDRMAILDAPPRLAPQEVDHWRTKTANYDSKFATLYYPWIEVMDPLTSKPLQIPPCGHVAGLWARTDSTRGVHKAPANEVVLGANSLGYQVTHEEQGSLNQSGVNCIRAFPGRGIRVWGARTLSSDPEWRYLNVRRLFNFVSESIVEGTQWSVFEPNDERLWARLRISASNFLTRVWRDGALFGTTPYEAFFVKCDAETNPPDVVEAGQVVIEIGIAPVKPAEFVIFKISQFTAGAPEVSA